MRDVVATARPIRVSALPQLHGSSQRADLILTKSRTYHYSISDLAGKDPCGDLAEQTFNIGFDHVFVCAGLDTSLPVSLKSCSGKNDDGPMRFQGPQLCAKVKADLAR